MKKPFVSVIVPTYKDWDRLNLCLDKLMVQSYGIENYEVIVVNNDPKDKKELLRKGVHLINEEMPGSYAARNAGLKVAKGEIVAFTDSDCIPEIDWIERAEHKISTSNVDRVAGDVKLFFTEGRLSFVEIYEKITAFNQKSNVLHGYSVTANFVTKKDVFENVGMFNDDLMSGGDVEWNLRASSKDYTIVYCPSCVVYHPARSTFQEISEKALRVTGGYLKNMKMPLMFIIKSFIPPLHKLSFLGKGRGFPIYERVIAFFVFYYLRIFVVFKYKARDQ